MNITYKKADASDIDILIKTRIQVLRAVNKLSDKADISLVIKESYLYYQNCFKDDTHAAYLAFDGDVFVGSGGICFYKVMPSYENSCGRKAYIMNIYTNPDYRRKRIAFTILDLLIKEAKNRSIYDISLEATSMGRPLYEKYGFIALENEMELHK